MHFIVHKNKAGETSFANSQSTSRLFFWKQDAKKVIKPYD